MEHDPSNELKAYWEAVLRDEGLQLDSGEDILSENPAETAAAEAGLSDEVNHAAEHRAVAAKYDNDLPPEHSA